MSFSCFETLKYFHGVMFTLVLLIMIIIRDPLLLQIILHDMFLNGYQVLQ